MMNLLLEIFFFLLLHCLLPYLLFLLLNPLHSLVLFLHLPSLAAQIFLSPLRFPFPSIDLCSSVLINLPHPFPIFFLSSLPHQDTGRYV